MDSIRLAPRRKPARLTQPRGLKTEHADPLSLSSCLYPSLKPNIQMIQSVLNELAVA